MGFDHKKMKALRLKAGISQKRAGWCAGFRLDEERQWARLETGRIKDPSVTTLQRVATALGVQIEDLLHKRWPEGQFPPCLEPVCYKEARPPIKPRGRPRKDAYKDEDFEIPTKEQIEAQLAGEAGSPGGAQPAKSQKKRVTLVAGVYIPPE